MNIGGGLGVKYTEDDTPPSVEDFAKEMKEIAKLIDRAIKITESNTNFNYVLDQLFFNILKEKFLCK